MKTRLLSSLLVLLVAIGCGKRTPKQAAAASAPGSSSDGQPTPGKILDTARASYAALTSYKASGSTVSIIDMSGMDMSKMPGMPAGAAGSEAARKAMAQAQAAPQTVKHSFTIALGRPGSYRVEWEQQTGPASQRGAVWSDGDADYLMITPKNYSKVQGRDMALGAATGVSGGAANTVPSAFFGTPNDMLKTLQDLSRRPDEPIDGEDCYVVEGTVGGMMKMVYWIGKKDFLIRQRQQVLGGAVKMPEMNDDTIRKSLEAMKQEATPEAIDKMRKTMKGAAAMSSQISGTITETHTDIKVNESLGSTAFAFKPPTGAKLVDSPFGNMFGGGKPALPAR